MWEQAYPTAYRPYACSGCDMYSASAVVVCSLRRHTCVMALPLFVSLHLVSKICLKGSEITNLAMVIAAGLGSLLTRDLTRSTRSMICVVELT